MLRELRIHNLALIEQAFLSFSPALNILTGETGAGKSALLYGLSLVAGERASSEMVRQGCDKSLVEALFDVNDSPSVLALLAEGGIDHEEGQDLLVRREIYASGKGRLFINHQPAQLSFLRRLALPLMRRVGQHTARSLFSLDYHRRSLDLYGGLQPILEAFQESYQRERELRDELELLKHQEAQRLREIETCRHEIEELDGARLKEGEEEELFAEYTLLTHAEELSAKIHSVHQALAGDRHPLLPLLNRQTQLLESLIRFDPLLHEPFQSFQNAFLELQEAAHTLQMYRGRLHADPERLNEINERLTLLNHLKRKYGATEREVLNYHAEAKERLAKLQRADLEREELQQKLLEAAALAKRQAHELTQVRRSSAIALERALTREMHSLNMPKAHFRIQIEAQERMREGEDRVEFFLRPNLGEREVALREGASGGELSRVLLALHTLLAEKEGKTLLVFDEVDANIGGETAAVVGEKLQALSLRHQVICITHFPQVAAKADCHLRISKEERGGRTRTQVQELDLPSRPAELARMAGSPSAPDKKIGPVHFDGQNFGQAGGPR